jgi:outer membrane protein OmpA-like peptidoglycan-associated protein
MRLRWPLAVVCASLLNACGASRLPDDMETYKMLRKRDYAVSVEKRYPHLAAAAQQHFRAALEADREGDDDLRRHYTWMALTIWRTAQTLSERQDAMDSRLAVDGRLALTDEAFEEAKRRREAAREVLAREARVREIAWRYADLPPQALARPQAAEDALEETIEALRLAAIAGAGTHAKQQLEAAQRAFDVAARALEGGRPEESVVRAREATVLAQQAAVAACPGDAHDRARRALRRQLAVLLSSAQSIPDVAPRITDRGVVMTLRRALDDEEGTNLRPDARPALAKIAELAEWFPGFRVEVEGHASASGSPTDDLIKTRFQSQTVVEALRSLGVPPARLSGVGKGSNEPVADFQTASGRAQNRRVDVVFVPMQVPVEAATCGKLPGATTPRITDVEANSLEL